MKELVLRMCRGGLGLRPADGDGSRQQERGQRQRVALARALATRPRVLLADEPTSALDSETRASVLNTLAGIRERLGVTILIITHDLHSAAGLCDSVTTLDAGLVVETGSVLQVLNRPSNSSHAPPAFPLPVTFRRPGPGAVHAP